ncbi:MAG: DUF1326 domain-containing protein [Candidatus Rokubacteria bacterium]|nr:DUF1326 domain-containing protein [Candidatus Rokubacteria bacterium]
MAKTKWHLSGDYFETCSCDYLCPCIPTNMAAKPTKGHCTFAFAFHVAEGRHGDVKLDGLNFAVVGLAPTVMGEGGWSVGLIVDERASARQRDAVTAIASGQAGGPMAAVGPLIKTFLGVESKPIRFEKKGMHRAVSIPGVLDQAVEGVPGAAGPNAPLHIDNTLHPANSRLALARATRSHLHTFGLDWDDTTGRNNGHFAPFKWKG